MSISILIFALTMNFNFGVCRGNNLFSVVAGSVYIFAIRREPVLLSFDKVIVTYVTDDMEGNFNNNIGRRWGCRYYNIF